MAKNVTTKNVGKRKNRRLRKQIRKTVGALLMVSAIAVAAVPVPDVSANPTDKSEKVKIAVTSAHGEYGSGTGQIKPELEYPSSVPYASASTREEEKIVYTSGDGLFQFAFTYIDATHRGAVILNFSNPGNNNSIDIPSEIVAYRKYSPNNTFGGYCLVSLNDELLGYREYQHMTNDAGKPLYSVVGYDQDGDNTAEEKILTSDDYATLPIDETTGRRYFAYTNDLGQPKRCEVEEYWDYKYYPCYYENRDKWDEGDKKIPNEQLFYHPKKFNTTTNKNEDDYSQWLPATDYTHWRVTAAVSYIGAEKIKESDTGWQVDDQDFRDQPGEGVFANCKNIVDLKIPDSLMGISDYAFWNCVNLNSVTFYSGINTIGNGAFADCINLKSVTIPPTINVDAIGKDAFYNCRSLESFSISTGMRAIGDCAFEGCTKLTTVNMLSAEKEVALSRLGNHLFRGCQSLSGIEFPSTYSEVDANGDTILDIDMFEGCKSLQYIKTSNEFLDFAVLHQNATGTPDPYPYCKDNDWAKFRDTVPPNFYIECPNGSPLHSTANDNEVTYKYPGEELYEKVAYEHDKYDVDEKGRSAKVVYQVNNSNELVKFSMLKRNVTLAGDNDPDNMSKPDVIAIPEAVGPFGISYIGAGSFNDNCFLKKVTIPASVTSIGENAFKGCHDLTTVIFTDASTIAENGIGPDAFKTQDTNCEHTSTLYPAAGADKPELYFVGAMMKADGSDTEPFKFAMSGADTSKISHVNSPDLWITCHSGWPTNLEVQYNDGQAQLIGYPRYDQLSNDWTDKTLEKILPYITDADETRYKEIVNHVKTLAPEALTPEERDLLQATKNVAIPKSVGSIKPGLFSGFDGEGNEVYENGADGKPDLSKPIGTDVAIESVSIYGVKEIEPYTFKGCTGLKSADIIGSELLDDYVFDECENLGTVTLGSNLKDTGKRPFRGCENLIQINCTEPSNFQYGKGILYRKVNDGLEIVQCLENRGQIPEVTGPDTIESDELAGVTSVKQEAFQNCKEISKVDLSGTTISLIPERCFKGTDISEIILPSSLKVIHDEAFQDGGSKLLTVIFKGDGNIVTWGSTTDGGRDLFKQTDPGEKQQNVKFVCPKDSNAYIYYQDHDIEKGSYIAWSDRGQEFTVNFWNLPDYPLTNNRVLISSQTVMAGEAADPPKENPTCLSNPELAFTGWDNDSYKAVTGNLDIYPTFGDPEWTVVFKDGLDRNVTIGEAQKVKNGRYPQFPQEEMIPKHEGYMFAGWDPGLDELAPGGITKDTDIMATYVLNDGSQFTVTFLDYDGGVIGKQPVKAGENAMAPAGPVRDGYTFTGWQPAKNLENVTEDRTVMATYERNTGGSNPNPSGGGGNNPNPSGGGGNNNNNNNSKPSASPKGSATAAPTATPANGDDVKKYTVTVSGGSGTGSYPAGAVVPINAYAMGVGQVFDKWTSSTAGVGFADATATSTTFTMPAANVAVTATYKTGGAGNAATGASGGSGGGSSSSGTVNNNGSSVEVSRPGISNTNLAGATVSGATDNFIVKISEDQAATDAATSALQARFGDLSRIKYFPMDISLYDSTGRTKIADTSGISVNLTLPLPDELVQYAGNNKMAAISGGALEDLNARFTTVSGVPCINFTATHFSPYVIYVDTANLTEATIDATPKTGDPIHPKWFLALGMASLSLILFFKRDKSLIKAKTA